METIQPISGNAPIRRLARRLQTCLQRPSTPLREETMPSFLVRALAERTRLPFVDETTIDAFLAPADGESEHSILFFTGDPAQRPE
eukprot:gene52825-72084_t